MIVLALIQMIVLISTDAASSSQKKKVEKRIVVKEFKNCDELNNVEGRFENMTISNLGKGRVGISADINSTYDFDRIDKVVAEVDKCKGSIKEKCEFFMKFPFNDGCKILKLKGQIWSPISLGFKPPLTCPFKKGIYRMRNAEFKMEHLNAFSNLVTFIDQYSWIVKVKIYRDNGLLLCFHIGADIISVRV